MVLCLILLSMIYIYMYCIWIQHHSSIYKYFILILVIPLMLNIWFRRRLPTPATSPNSGEICTVRNRLGYIQNLNYYSIRSVICYVQYMICYLLCIVYDLLCIVCDLLSVTYSIWSVMYSIRFVICYADNAQVYIILQPCDKLDDTSSSNEACIVYIIIWITINMLKLKKDKTEFIIFSSKEEKK